jgi:hypothetical protein
MMLAHQLVELLLQLSSVSSLSCCVRAQHFSIALSALLSILVHDELSFLQTSYFTGSDVDGITSYIAATMAIASTVKLVVQLHDQCHPVTSSTAAEAFMCLYTVLPFTTSLLNLPCLALHNLKVCHASKRLTPSYTFDTIPCVCYNYAHTLLYYTEVQLQCSAHKPLP